VTAITRRRFLAVVAAAAASGAAAFAWRGRSGGGHGFDGSEALAAVFPDPDGARALGRAWLAARPASTDDLLDALAPPGRDARAWMGAADPPGLRRHLRRRAAADFDRGRVVVAGGWRLARAEADACALLARA
jgi:hypothetical protein